ncbi:MAG: Hydrogenase expression/formation protein HypE [Thermococcales archaeon 44_46]|jgi:hydrogenase maturation factor|uniref:AIR synthase family protein n=1 Tax=Thermococcus TaxID=2263 RepID=UPI0005B2BA17|nr:MULTISPECIES: AIR synthase family protein [Thermococcus]KUJ98471.1 MAG: Hydrogenase expression/formation protein HypE [Thermococcales archaeon 44_46]MCA6214880.1 hydrogenase assembly protein HupF [Thermococcus bergensis]HIH73185.1 hydrogenase assembly protein HupF [Thermococcaceae archaeon]
MLPLGKIRNEVLRKIILSDLPIDDEKIVVGPKEGFDAAVLEYDGDNYLVIATDPVLGVPREHFGFFTYHFASSDVAVFGARPRWLIVDLLLHPGTKEEELKAIMDELRGECKKYGTSIVGGHTGVYKTINDFTATTTAVGIVRKDELKLPLAKPGDDIVITKGVAIEFAVGAAWFKAEELKSVLSPSETSFLREMYKLESVVKDALLAREFARGMHDATEGGLTALHEIADNSGVGFEVYYENLYMHPLVEKVVNFYGVNPLTVSSTGTLIIISPRENTRELIKKLQTNGVGAFVIGQFTEERERVLIKNGRREEFPEFERDAYAEVYY